MARNTTNVPVDESLQVTDVTELYQTDEWWKAVVSYQFADDENDANDVETAVYLWHHDDDWKRKNKYVIKTEEAWKTDRDLINTFIANDAPATVTSEFPASDYYTIATGETVFKEDGWWKAIVNVVQKGTYDTDEVMVYLWEQEDDTWRRRQKYTIKSFSDWEEERTAIDEQLSLDLESGLDDIPDTGSGVSDDITDLGEELDSHLSGEFT